MRTPRTFRAVPIGTTTLWTGHRNREGARKPGVAAPTTSKAYNTVHTHMYIRCVWWCQVELVNSCPTAPGSESATAARGPPSGRGEWLDFLTVAGVHRCAARRPALGWERCPVGSS